VIRLVNRRYRNRSYGRSRRRYNINRRRTGKFWKSWTRRKKALFVGAVGVSLYLITQGTVTIPRLSLVSMSIGGAEVSGVLIGVGILIALLLFFYMKKPKFIKKMFRKRY